MKKRVFSLFFSFSLFCTFAFSGELHIDLNNLDPLTSAIFRGVEEAFNVNEKGLDALQSGDFEEAERLFIQAGTIIPIYSEARNNLGVVYFSTGREQEAARIWRNITMTDPDYPLAWFNLGLFNFRAGNTMEAERLFEIAYLTDPANEDIWEFYAYILVLNNQIEKAISILERKIPSQTALEMLEEIQTARAQEMATAEERRALTAEELFNIALEYHLAGDLQTAVKLYEEVLAKDRRFHRAWNNLGAIFGSRGEIERAISAYKNATGRRSDTADGYVNLVNIYSATGDTRNARRWLRRGLRRAPQNEYLLIFQQQLQG
ncbi:MAG: tetratricopeptide repeat protein [Chitinivibrionia bacterium]|nr:tetratricopeptide repeat protein [Chitinivibrionia bacterium]